MEPLATSISGVFTIANSRAKSRVLDIKAGSVENGAALQLYTSNRTPAQRFRIQPVSGEPGYYTIVNVKSNKALDVPAAQARSRTVIQQYAQNGTDAQKWVFVPTGDADGSYVIAPKLNRKLCLATTSASTSNGASLKLYARSGAFAQTFLLNKIDPLVKNGLYTIQSGLAQSRVLDVASASLADRANIQIYQSNNTLAQKFRLTYNKNSGYYLITSSLSNKLLGIEGASGASGSNVMVSKRNRTYTQMWAIESDGKGAYVLYAACGGTALNVQGASTKNKTNVQVYKPNKAAAQSWTFAPASVMDDGIYLVTSALGTTLDAKAGGTDPGTNIQAYAVNRTLAQRFFVKHQGGGYYTLECLNSGLLVAGVAKSGNVQLEGASIDDSKLWKPLLTGDGYVNLQNKLTGKALHVRGATAASGANVQLATATKTVAQKWTLAATVPLPSGYYTMASALNTGLVVDIPAASRENGAVPQLYVSNDTAAQRFNIVAATDGSYTIAAACSNKPFDVKGGVIDASGVAALQQNAANASKAQKWRIDYIGAGRFVVRSLLRVRSCLTVQGQVVDGAPLALNLYSAAASQQFVITPVSNVAYVSYKITLDQMAGYQKAGNPYLGDYSLAEIRDALDPGKLIGTAPYQFADLRSYSGLTAAQINAYLGSTALGRTGILKQYGGTFVKASQQYKINECFLVAHAINETGWGTSTLAKGYYYDGKTAIEGSYYPAGTYYNFFGIGAFDSSPLSGGRSMAIQNGWNTPSRAIVGGAAWIAKYYLYAPSTPQPTVYDMKWDVAYSNQHKTYGFHQYATDPFWPSKNSRLMSECYAYNSFTPGIQYLIPVYA
ncbi:MAG: RICIN domain-containing protein [Coriobacteriales bacterium]|nr:RICIN domain-containing protein [Coriobacteriales bacterium]